MSACKELIIVADADLLRLSQMAENLQHGHSSGIDIYLALHGGCIYYQNQHVERRVLPTVNFYTINTGVPEATTGECVAAAAKTLATDPGLQNAFGDVTVALDRALQHKDTSRMQACIRENHRLLCQLGIVPPLVQELIAALERHAASAKICGAGNIRGESAGIVLVSTPHDMTELVQEWGYVLQKVVIDTQGVHVV